jgi:hypothetical protein
MNHEGAEMWGDGATGAFSRELLVCPLPPTLPPTRTYQRHDEKCMVATCRVRERRGEVLGAEKTSASLLPCCSVTGMRDAAMLPPRRAFTLCVLRSNVPFIVRLYYHWNGMRSERLPCQVPSFRPGPSPSAPDPLHAFPHVALCPLDNLMMSHESHDVVHSFDADLRVLVLLGAHVPGARDDICAE